MSSTIPSMFGTVIIDAKSLYDACRDRVTIPPGNPENAFRAQMLEATSQLKRIIVEHKPRQMLMLHTSGFSDSLATEEKLRYEGWTEMSIAMGVPQETLPRNNIYGFMTKALNNNRASGRPGLIVSGDGLLGANLENDIYYEDVHTLSIYGYRDFVDFYGFNPNYLVELYGLVGHEDLGIKGIDFIGPRKASEWLSGLIGNPVDFIESEYGDTRLGRIFVKNKAKFIANLGAIEDVMSHPSNPLPSMSPDIDKNHALHEHFKSPRVMPHRENFNRLLEKNELFELLPTNSVSDKAAHISRISAVSAINSLEKSKSLSMYFENSSKTGELIGVGISDGSKSHGFPIGIASDYDKKWLSAKLDDLIKRKNIIVVASDAKSYYKFLGDGAKSLHADSAVLSYTINSGNGKTSFVDLASRFAPDVEFNHAPYESQGMSGKEECGDYLAERSHVALMLNRRLYEIAKNTPALEYYKKIEEPMARILAKMDGAGISIDVKRLSEIKEELEVKQDEILNFINRRLPNGEQVDVLNKAKIEHLLFDVFRLTPPKMTRTRSRSVGDDALEQLEQYHWLPGKIREYKKINTLITSTIDPISRRMKGEDGKVYPTFNQCITITGRLSATDPNVQGVPQRTPEGRMIREAFSESYDYSIVAADYSQIELRILAHISKDEGLLSVFRSGGDPHSATAAEVFGTTQDKVTKEQRTAAKGINFGIVYGLTPFGLAKQLKVDEKQASEFIERYFKAFPGVKAYLDKISEDGIRQGYVDTLKGRRISLFSENQGSTKRDIDAVKRRACNYPMQGSAAEIIKEAMIEVDAKIIEDFPDASMLMQVHDELVFRVPESQESVFCKRLKEVMESVSPLSVPLEVDVHAGPSWSEELTREGKALKENEKIREKGEKMSLDAQQELN